MRHRLLLRRWAARWTRTRPRGQALVELALVIPVLFLLLAGALDLGRLFYSQITIRNAAREGALEASVNPTSFQAGQACNDTTNRVMCRAITESQNSFVTVAPANVSLTCNPTSCATGLGNTVALRVTGTFQLIMPLLSVFTGGQTFTIESTATAQIATAPSLAAAPTPTPTPAPTPTPTPAPTPTPTPGPTPTPTPTPTPPPCFAPVANFSWSAVGSKKVNFTDASTNMSVAACNPIWSWNFGDGSGTSSLQNPSYTYQSSNARTVTLVVSNTAGSNTVSKQVNP